MIKAILFVVLFGAAAAATPVCNITYNRIYSGDQNIVAGPFTVNRLADCCASCQANPDCTGFNYRFDSADPTGSRHTCTEFSFTSYSLTYLYGSHFGVKNSSTPVNPTGPAPVTTVQSVASATTGTSTTGSGNSPFISCLGRREAGVDYWVGYLNRTQNVTEAECCAGCKAYPGCNAYSWGTDGANVCYYRAYRGGFHGTYEMNSGYRPNSTLPAATGFSCAAATRETGIDYWGPNLSQAMTATEAECCAVCEAYQGCAAYSWTVEDDVCYIKPYASDRHQSAGIRSGYTVYVAPTTTAAPVFI